MLRDSRKEVMRHNWKQRMRNNNYKWMHDTMYNNNTPHYNWLSPSAMYIEESVEQ